MIYSPSMNSPIDDIEIKKLEITKEEAIPLLKLLEKEYLPREPEDEYIYLVNLIRRLREFINE